MKSLTRLAVVATLHLLGNSSQTLAQEVAPPVSIRSLAIEGDAVAYGLSGYSGIVRMSLSNGLNVALGTGRYELPGFIVKEQPHFDEAHWRATSESIQVLRVGYRFGAAMKNGFVLDGIAINQRWKVTAESLSAATKFSTLSTGVSTGYYLHIGKHFYLYPTASFTYTTLYSGENMVQSSEYDIPKWQPNGSLHAGWEWAF